MPQREVIAGQRCPKLAVHETLAWAGPVYQSHLLKLNHILAR